MAIDFPNSPAPGNNFTVNGKTWSYTDGKWALNVSVGGVQGPTGPTGVTGPSGTAATVSVGTVTNGATGGVVNAGTSTAAVLNITLPIGATGPQGGVGATGPQGVVGATGAASSVAGPQGGVGATGPQGGVGATGAAGAAGAAGTNGTNGTNGADSTVPGPQGPVGPAGSYNSGTGIQVGIFEAFNTMYYYSPGPSSATEGIVRISTGEMKKNSASGVSLRDHKEDIVPMENALEQLSLLQPRNFRFKEEILVPNEPYDFFNRHTQLQYGFVMEEVRDSVPDLVMHKSPDGIEHEAMYWKESGMIALAVKAIQELSAQVAALRIEINELRGY